MKRIGLVECTKSKLKDAQDNPTNVYPAKDMYTGYNFRKAVSDGLDEFECSRYYILSDRYGLIEPDDLIHYYEFDLAKQSVAYKKAWSDKVYDELVKKLGNIDNVEFVFFAGEIYYKYLKERLNCITLKFVGRKVTFDVKQTY